MEPLPSPKPIVAGEPGWAGPPALATGEEPTATPAAGAPGVPPVADRREAGPTDEASVSKSHLVELAKDKYIDSDDDQEVDVWWGSYAGRAMAPSFVVCALLTVLIIWAVWLFWPTNEDRPYLMRYTDYILVGAVWLFQLVRWGYRIIGINYRLTTKRLFCQRGFQNSATRALDLTRIATVRVERLPLVHFLKVGLLRVIPVDDSQPPLVLESVPYPDHVAAGIMKQVKSAHEKGKTGGRS